MSLSIVIPVYNSETILDTLITTLKNEIEKDFSKIKYEIFLINDNSFDNSWEKILSIANNNNNIKGINLKNNFGQHNAIFCGLIHCQGEYIITMDDDLQHHPKYIKNILNALKFHDACYTNYKKRKHKMWKRFVSWLNNIITSILLDKPFRVYLSSFRGFNKDVLKKIIKFKNSNIYLDSLILSSTKKIKMITVDHYERYEGASNYKLKQLLLLWTDMILNLEIKKFSFASFIGIILKVLVKIFRKKKMTPQFEIKEKTF